MCVETLFHTTPATRHSVLQATRHLVSACLLTACFNGPHDYGASVPMAHGTLFPRHSNRTKRKCNGTTVLYVDHDVPSSPNKQRLKTAFVAFSIPVSLPLTQRLRGQTGPYCDSYAVIVIITANPDARVVSRCRGWLLISLSYSASNYVSPFC